MRPASKGLSKQGEWVEGFLGAVMDIRRRLTQRIVDFLNEPLPHYERHVWNDPQALRRHIRKGDVLLVDGDSRIAAIIKYLTQSSWSHAALFIGDELLRRGGPAAEAARREFGDEAAYLMVEALPHGVAAAPLSKYVDFNIRIARPFRLRPEHLKLIIDEAVASIGWRYDLRNVLDLARYLIPVRVIPDRFRRAALHFGSGQATEVICSSLLGRLFQRVGFPILPSVEFPDGHEATRHAGRWSFVRRVLGHESAYFTGIFRMRHPTLLTPRDFDLSPYFQVVKFNTVAEGHFDYQQIHWADDPPPAAALTGAKEPIASED
jgi:hypothetical protein